MPPTYILIFVLSPFSVCAQLNTPVEQSLSDISGVSEHGFPVVGNPAAVALSEAFLGFGSYFRGSGLYQLGLGGSYARKIFGTGGAIFYLGDHVYRRWVMSLAISADAGPVRLGLRVQHMNESFRDSERLSLESLHVGLQTKKDPSLMVGAYLQVPIFSESKILFCTALRYRVHPYLMVFVESAWIDKNRPHFKIAGTIDFPDRYRFRFGVDFRRSSVSIGLERLLASARITCSLAYHNLIGIRSQIGFFKSLDRHENH